MSKIIDAYREINTIPFIYVKYTKTYLGPQYHSLRTYSHSTASLGIHFTSCKIIDIHIQSKLLKQTLRLPKPKLNPTIPEITGNTLNITIFNPFLN